MRRAARPRRKPLRHNALRSAFHHVRKKRRNPLRGYALSVSPQFNHEEDNRRCHKHTV